MSRMKFILPWVTHCSNNCCYHYTLMVQGKRTFVLCMLLDVKRGDYFGILRSLLHNRKEIFNKFTIFWKLERGLSI